MNKELTILTRHYPPNKNINGVLACELANYLQQNYDITTNVVCMNTSADGNLEDVLPIGNVVKINPLFKTQNSLFKLLNLVYDGFSMVKYAKTNFANSFIICTTSPPLLPFWVSKIFNSNMKWALWSLDLFPEGFAANNQVSKSNFIYKYLLKATYKLKPNYLIALGDKQANFIERKYASKLRKLIMPAGVLLNQKSKVSKAPPSWYDSNKIILGYFGNLGIPHNPDFIVAIINNLKSNQKFILSCYGVFSEKVKKIALKNKNVTIVEGGIPEEHLKYINIHLVSLKSNWTHIAVPSKAVTAVSVGRPILFCGSLESDNWQMFKNAGWIISESENIEKQCISFLNCINIEGVNAKSKNTLVIYNDLKQSVLNSYEEISNIVKSI